MTGQLIYENKGHFPDSKGSTLGTLKVESWEKSPRWRFTRVIFTFTDGSRLLFNDLRKFGWIKIVSETDLPKIFRETGVEPLSRNFTLTRFTEIIARYPKRKIKSLLLDQKLIAGLGNIYTDESCFLAGILPTRIIKSLTLDNRKKLHSAIIKVLKLAISKKGTSARDYVRANGQPGSFVPYLNVYGRDQKNCKICGAKISKIKLNGRGTHFCAHCQK
jgi:formamidopyrimidine-DNA glycosylase